MAGNGTHEKNRGGCIEEKKMLSRRLRRETAEKRGITFWPAVTLLNLIQVNNNSIRKKVKKKV